MGGETTPPSLNRDPNTPPPPGADVLNEWDEWEGGVYRHVQSVREILDAKVLITGTATQLLDGSIDADGRVSDAPMVWIDEFENGVVQQCLTVSVNTARILAAEIIAAADELDGWASR